ncbi:unnamed protein product [Rotaria socialis]|uniref:Uncharacterized protein n=1 Tax=Rotaria socialis TaxID=392032 RepID=A0A817M7Q4_9BILA|nr:unnamed protein product [Rotaria socialis]CAF3321914.1 unnamed protein product [Rotaria socialis]CAF3321923.1 unnamed protein product [Rotaria socialis]CAF3403903.1 unnamed protein product [Rotaria socialis]CAF4175995.1 unnamed protein product [Rotaria socialis]
MPAPMDMDSDRASINSLITDAYMPDFFDASIADLAELLNNEPKDDFIVGLRNTLADVFSSKTIVSLAHCHDLLIRFIQHPEMMCPVSTDNLSLVTSLLKDLEIVGMTNKHARELDSILRRPHIRMIMDAHQTIATREYAEDQLPIGYLPDAAKPLPDISSPSYIYPGTVSNMIPKTIGIESTGEEHLGITVRLNDMGDLEIKRIVQGGLIDKQGLLHVGDIIKEINGEIVNTPEELQDKLRNARGAVTFKVIPNYFDFPSPSQLFIRTHFSYDPAKDKLIPAKEAGLAFDEGDILQILSQDDVHWWQARQVKDATLKGLIPSQYLEERRKAFVSPENDFSKTSLVCGLIDRRKKKKLLFNVKDSSMFDKGDICLYEEVARMPPFERKCLILIGAHGVGRRDLKNRLIALDPKRFGTARPHTSRLLHSDSETNAYFQMDRNGMEAEIEAGAFLEHGFYSGDLYGTKFESVQRVIQSGKMCVLDIEPTALKLICNKEYMPYVVFLKAPNMDYLRYKQYNDKQRMPKMRTKSNISNNSSLNLLSKDPEQVILESDALERDYHTYFDLTLVSEDADKTFEQLVRAVEALSAEPQWVNVQWFS